MVLLTQITSGEPVLQLSRKTNITYCYAHHIIYYLESKDFVSIIKKGRTLNVTITPEGEKLKCYCKKIIKILEKKGLNNKGENVFLG